MHVCAHMHAHTHTHKQVHVQQVNRSEERTPFVSSQLSPKGRLVICDLSPIPQGISALLFYSSFLSPLLF